MSEPTFTLSAEGKSIICHRCGSTSHNANDVTFHYCGRCNKWHDAPDVFNADVEATVLQQTAAIASLIVRTMPGVDFFLTTKQAGCYKGSKHKLGVSVVTNLKKEEVLELLQGVVDNLKTPDCSTVIVRTE